MIQQCIEIAKEAGKVILEVYASGNVEAQYKSDKSPVTEADLKANEVITSGLKKISTIPVVSEESFDPEFSRESLDRYWLIDPLDGTKEFLKRTDDFTVNIALIEGKKSVLGVVHAPVHDLTYWASKGKGAFRDGEKIANQRQDGDMVAVASRSHLDEKTQKFLDENKIENLSRIGSSLKICKVADGGADMYPRFGPTSEWDTAAGHIIAEEGGCEVLSLPSLEPLVYSKPSILNPEFIVMRRGLNLTFH